MCVLGSIWILKTFECHLFEFKFFTLYQCLEQIQFRSFILYVISLCFQNLHGSLTTVINKNILVGGGWNWLIFEITQFGCKQLIVFCCVQKTVSFILVNASWIVQNFKMDVIFSLCTHSRSVPSIKWCRM
jgi:hypothetical protein